MLPPPGLAPTPTLTSSSLLATATALLNSTTTSLSSPHSKPPPNGECSLLGPFAIFVQGALGCLALLALVYKRWRERPQRPLKIWFFDASKQVVGSVLVHIANLLMSMLSSGQLSIKLEPSIVERGVGGVLARMVDGEGKYRPNPCSFYLLNLAIDTTIGIPILIFLLRLLTAIFSLTPLGNPRESIESGNYGTPPRTWWWFKQSIIYFIGLMGMKICVLIIFLVLPWISRVGDWALKWTDGDEALQVIFVMLVFPVIMNATQYYIIDSFIKNQNPAEHELIPGEDVDEHEEYVEGSGSSDAIHSGDEEDEELKTKVEEVKTKGKGSSGHTSEGSSRSGSDRRKRDEYDPLFDGESTEASPVSGSAGSSKVKGADVER